MSTKKEVEKQFKELGVRKSFKEPRQTKNYIKTEASLFYEEKLKEAILDEEAAVRMYHYLPSIAKEAGFDNHAAGFAIIAQQEETHKKHLGVMLNETKRSYK